MSRHLRAVSNTSPPRAGTSPLVTSAEALRHARMMKHNPLPWLKPQMLGQALDSFEHGFLREAVLLWEKIAERDDVIASVKPKREKDVSQLNRQVRILDENNPQAVLHQQVIEDFWDNVRCVNSYDRNERGGFRRLVKQMMTAVSFRYAAHHIIWTPRPDGALRATFEFVPLWMFENRTGRLRYLPALTSQEGAILADGEWMVTTGDGLMISCCIGYLAKRSAFNDWLIFSEKFSVPGVMGRTTGKKDSPEGLAMRAAVESFGHDWTAVVYGDDGTHAEPIKLVQAAGNPSGMPMPAVIERVDRKFAALYRGADLSSMSSNSGDGTGASLQEKETGILRRDDAETIAETLEEISRMVIEWHFGTGVEPLARLELVVPVQEDTEKVVSAGIDLAAAGARVSTSALMARAGIPAAKDDADLLGRPPSPTSQPSPTSPPETLHNATTPAPAWMDALAADLRPLGSALESALLAGDESAVNAALKKISQGMPDFLETPGLEAWLEDGLVKALAGGGEDVENAARYNPQPKGGGRSLFLPWNGSRESRAADHRDQFGPVPSKGSSMTSGQQQDRAWRAMEHVMATKGRAPRAVIREDIGEIQFDYGDPSPDSGWGLSHLKVKHPDAWHRIPATLVEGKAFRHPVHDAKAIIAKDDHMVVIQRKDKRHGWVISGLADPKTIGKLTPLKS